MGRGIRSSRRGAPGYAQGVITSQAREDAETAPLFRATLAYVAKLCAVLYEGNCLEESW